MREPQTRIQITYRKTWLELRTVSVGGEDTYDLAVMAEERGDLEPVAILGFDRKNLEWLRDQITATLARTSVSS